MNNTIKKISHFQIYVKRGRYPCTKSVKNTFFVFVLKIIVKKFNLAAYWHIRGRKCVLTFRKDK